MLHWYVVGHIDPLDPKDTTALIHRPKILRPLLQATAEAIAAEFGCDIAEYVGFEEPGFVVCHWSIAPRALWNRVREFAFFLAERERAMVMDECFMVHWPREAIVANRQWWAQFVEPNTAQEGRPHVAS